MSDVPGPAFGYIFGGDVSESQADAREDSASGHRSSHSPVLSHKTLGVATPVLWDDRDKASRSSSSYKHQIWTGGLAHVLDPAASSSTQGSSKPGPEWPRGEEAGKHILVLSRIPVFHFVEYSRMQYFRLRSR